MDGSKKISREDIRGHILLTAKKMFLEKGYLGTSLRDIARAGDVSIGRMYVYYKKKNDIFYELIKPILLLLDSISVDNLATKSSEEEQLDSLFSCETFDRLIRRNIGFVDEYREEFTLAFFRSKGFEKVDIREKIKLEYKKSHLYTVELLRKHGYINDEYNEEATINTISKIYISIYEEYIKNDMTDEQKDKYITEMAKFLYHGNLGLMK